jgi:hypothetical protein
MLDLTALPKRYLDQMGRERVAELCGVTTSVISMWVSRGTFPLEAVQKLLEADPSPIHEIKPLYENPAQDIKLSIIVPSATGRHPMTEACLFKLKTPQMEIVPESFNSLYHVRNMAAARFLKSEREWSFWSDADMVHQCGDAVWFKQTIGDPNFSEAFAGVHAIHRLLVHKKSIVSVCYVEKKHGGQAVFQGAEDSAVKATLRHGPSNNLLARDWCGFGGVLVHRKVFTDIIAGGFAPRAAEWARRRLGYEWGFFNPTEDNFGDDISFCARAKNAGHQTHIDLSLMSSHLGTYAYSYKDLR